MGITYSEVVEEGLLSDEILDCIEEAEAHICECGEEVEFTDSLKQMYCPNPRCHLKIAARLYEMTEKLEVVGWGEESCLTVCRTFGLKSPYQAFLLEGKECAGVSVFNQKVLELLNSPKRNAYLWEVVSYGSIPGVDTIAFKIFGDYESFEDAYKDIEEYQVPFIAEKLGYKNSDSGVMAVNIYNTLMQYKGELFFAETMFNIKKNEGVVLKIVITGGVAEFKNKSSFVEFLNSRYTGKLRVVRTNSLTNDVDVLISDSGESNSKKYKTAMKINEKRLEAGEEPIVIATSEELIEALDSEYLESIKVEEETEETEETEEDIIIDFGY